ncbi:MAG: bifunctional methylenetetrahydrofolate dehydrogenase/methenyltetrahydrofolate cyclohydrolase FolD [Phototrophicaceae bacterium]|jgi:5,10-methylene-tetrahydrofolate dehydrogenase/methenyl tetrahydrofolate cyclohydrolase
MTAKILNGTEIAARLRAELATQVSAFTAERGYPPGLGVVLVGDNPASHAYVRMKKRACAEVGIESETYSPTLAADVSQAALLKVVQDLNENPRVHGILVQLPLPKHIDEEVILAAVSLDKDVDGFHPLNIGKLAQKGRDPLFTPATPTGVMALLAEAGVDLRGKHAVVIGRSNIVGMPTALLLLKQDATVTIVHSRTVDAPAIIRTADVVIAAAGVARYVKGEWLKPGAVVIDVGTNRVDDPTTKSGYRLVGDVDFESALEVAGVITPVPGGVGPMTIGLLLSNTVKAALRT